MDSTAVARSAQSLKRTASLPTKLGRSSCIVEGLLDGNNWAFLFGFAHGRFCTETPTPLALFLGPPPYGASIDAHLSGDFLPAPAFREAAARLVGPLVFTVGVNLGLDEGWL